MDQTILVDEKKRAGLALVRALDQAGIPVSAAFWYELPETGRWRLFIVSPWVDSRGSLATYHQIVDVIQAGPTALHIGIDDVTAIGEDDVVLRRLISTFAARPDGVRIELPAEDRGGVDFGDAYIYRLIIPASAAHSARRR